MTTKKLDAVTYRDWKTSVIANHLPTFEELLNFLQHRCNMLENLIPNENKQGTGTKRLPTSNYTSKSYLLAQVTKCPLCKLPHKLFECKKFLGLPIKVRYDHVKKFNMCINCLRSGHKVDSCRSSHTCNKCKHKHNTLLHFIENPSQTETKSTENQQATEPQPISVTHTTTRQCTKQTLLATAVLNLVDSQGNLVPCKALLDCASQMNFITQSCFRSLGLKQKRVEHTICGVNASVSKAKNVANIELRSTNNSFQISSDCLILPSITQLLPSYLIDVSGAEFPVSIQLADPTFNVPSTIDLLLGADIFWRIILSNRIKIPNSSLELVETKLGWVVTGETNQGSTNNMFATHICTLEDINQTMQKFWAVEEPKEQRKFTGNDKLCEDIFQKTTTRDSSGKYTVQIPLKGNPNALGESKEMAERRLSQLERRLTKDPETYEQYRAFMHEYEALGHMKRLTNEDTIDNTSYFIPHHAVIRETSTTTRLRVVFDASAKTSSGLSLNDISISGPTVQSDLISILIRFRTHNYVITADIEKMYRQVRITPDQFNLQQILWRDNIHQPISVFQLQTVTYGTASAPFLATRTLNQLAIDEQHDLPTASKVTLEDFYVDDLMTGGSTIAEVKQLQTELIELTKRGAFHLRKWNSNNSQLLTDLPPEDVVQSHLSLDQDPKVKTLGLVWNPRTDTFKFSTIEASKEKHLTKRNVLASIGRIFDPLGLIAPVVVIAKLIMQQLWCRQLHWDDLIPSDIQQQWEHYQTSLINLSQLHIPRAIINTNQDIRSLEIHGFADASESAYGACLYMRSIDNDNNKTIRLITSKSRIAPIKKTSLPRLELCAALLLAELGKQVITSLQKNIDKVVYYSDSTVALAWISSPSSHWTTFVANRVARIQELSEKIQWRHIKGEDNPADLVSRGLLPQHLLKSDLYWNGPAALETHEVIGSRYTMSKQQAIPEGRLKTHTLTSASTFSNHTSETIDFSRYSTFAKTIRVVAYCRRFLKGECGIRHNNNLTAQELKAAELSVIKLVQGESFASEVRNLKEGLQLPKTSKLLTLTPWIDSQGLLRVGGRLRHSNLDHEQRHPLILPKGHRIALLIAIQEHKRAMHAGPQLLLSVIRQKYWPIGGRNLSRRVFQRCIKCAKCAPTTLSQIMGDLPRSRVQPSRPFQTTGVDYCGPFYITLLKRRGSTTQKAYIAVFICFTTKAIHLELVEDLSSSSFLAALRRFISRRGKPLSIYSDNGTNFIGANRELKVLLDLWKSEQFSEVVSSLAHEGIEWHFLPPRAPHFGGLWESAVRLTKNHIKRTVGQSKLSFIQFSTLLTQIESFLNSRPLTPMSDDPNDFAVLTPSHFLTGYQLTSIPEPDLTSTLVNKLDRWQYVQRLTQQFWKRWSNEYLHHLQQRTKWKFQQVNVKINQLVLIKEDSIPSLNWKMGRIIKTHPGPDGNIRVVTVRSSQGEFKRPITKLCPLPTED